MKNFAEKIKEQTSKLATKMAEQEFSTWPPTCLGPFYQPERPQSVDTQNKQNDLG